MRSRNLPSGEVCACPNEAADSKTEGEIPAVFEGETIVFEVKSNQIIGVRGDGEIAEKMRRDFDEETALRNVAEVAIGCNDRAVVTGNVLEDEKAGFHWAYGRSDFLGGKVGVGQWSRFPSNHCSSPSLTGYGQQLRLRIAGTAADRRPSPSPHFNEEPSFDSYTAQGWD